MQRIKIRLITVNLLAMILFAGWITPVQGIAEETWKKRGDSWNGSTALQAELRPSTVLSIEHCPGEIKIIGDQEETEILLHLKTTLHSRIDAEQMLHSSMPDIIPSDSVLLLQWPKESYTLELAQSSLELIIKSSVSMDLLIQSIGHSISVGNIHGNMTVIQQNGNIELNRIMGDIGIQATSSNIRLEDIQGNLVTSQVLSDCSIGSMNGSLEYSGSMSALALEHYEGEISLQMNGGDFTCSHGKIPRFSIESTLGKVWLQHVVIDSPFTISAMAGDVTLDRCKGKATILARSGQITLTRFEGDVRINKNTGNITVNEPEGNVFAKTDFGDITYQLSRKKHLHVDSLSAVTGSGEISVTISEPYPESIRAKLKKSLGDLHIDSDFPLEYSTEGETMTGTGIFDQEGPIIDLETGLGNITIRKLNPPFYDLRQYLKKHSEPSNAE